MSYEGREYVLNQISRVRNILPKQGYKDSKNKTGLYYKVSDGGVFYADTRSNEIYPHGRMNPLFWFQVKDRMEEWRANRLRDELMRNESISLRLACVNVEKYDHSDQENGYCKLCKTDFRSDGLLCPSCRDKIYRCNICSKPIDQKKVLPHFDREYLGELDIIEIFQSSFYELCGTDHTEEVEARRLAEVKKEAGQILANSPFCELCGTKLVEKIELPIIETAGLNVPFLVNHHVNYKDNKTITICQSCHAKIHHSNDPEYNKYLPPDKRPKIEKKRAKKLQDESEKRCPTCKYYGIDCYGTFSKNCNKYRYSDAYKAELGIPIFKDKE